MERLLYVVSSLLDRKQHDGLQRVDNAQKIEPPTVSQARFGNRPVGRIKGTKTRRRNWVYSPVALRFRGQVGTLPHGGNRPIANGFKRHSRQVSAMLYSSSAGPDQSRHVRLPRSLVPPFDACGASAARWAKAAGVTPRLGRVQAPRSRRPPPHDRQFIR